MGTVVILGVFVADTAYVAARQPRMGETILGNDFRLGPGGKGSNQAVAAAKAGAATRFITRLGQDTFAQMALAAWAEAGVTPAVTHHPDSYTGAAYIFVDAASGDNAIIVAPGAAAGITGADVAENADLIRTADVFVTQLEQPQLAALAALSLARASGVVTVLNPAPAAPLLPGMLEVCDYVIPNETEAEALTGIAVRDLAGAEAAAASLIARGAGAAIVTLGERGALYLAAGGAALHVPAFAAGPVVETAGAGDAFIGGFAAALAAGDAPERAIRFGCATAGISVTRPGTAPSMPGRAEIEALLARG
ncbi:MAG: ribokinase [Paracoccus sp. (in: a-proteobacteria)]